MEKYGISSLDKLVMATDVKAKMPVKMKYDGIDYSFDILLHYGGRNVSEILQASNRMERTDWMNGNRPLTTDNTDTVVKKVAFLQDCVKKGTVAVIVGAKASTVVVVNIGQLIEAAQASGDWTEVLTAQAAITEAIEQKMNTPKEKEEKEEE
jgi:hypothetical protein